MDQDRVQGIEAAEPAITRLRAAVSRWTHGDFEADPFFHRLIPRLDPDGREHRAFLHARAALLHRPLSPQPGRLVEDWRAVLQRLLDNDVPPATLRLDTASCVKHSGLSDGYLTGGVPPWVDAALHDVSERDASVLRNPRSALAGTVPVARGSVALAGTNRDWYNERTGVVIPDEKTTPPGGEDERWGELFDAWLSGRRGPGLALPAIASKPIGALPWRDADRSLGLIWLALRAAVRSAQMIRLHDGRALVPISDGLVAEVDVRETAAPVVVQGVLDASSTGSLEDWKLVVGVESSVPGVQLAIPGCVTLLGEKARVDVAFLGSPLVFRRERASSHHDGPGQ